MDRGLDALLPHKREREVFLREQRGDLFALAYDLLRYDVTSTYFEGEAQANPLAQRGDSRDKRGDCKQVCIGLVVSRCGMPLGYEVFAGNTADVTKEKARHKRFEKRIEEGLVKMQAGCPKRKYKPLTIARRVGKRLGKNSRAAGRFDIDVQERAEGGTDVSLRSSKNCAWWT